jgi:hypothetical protein
MASGAILCPDCGGEDSSTVRLSEDGRRLIEAMLQARMSDVPELDASRDTVAEVLELMREFTVYHVPARIKALDMYTRVAGDA